MITYHAYFSLHIPLPLPHFHSDKVSWFAINWAALSMCFFPTSHSFSAGSGLYSWVLIHSYFDWCLSHQLVAVQKATCISWLHNGLLGMSTDICGAVQWVSAVVVSWSIYCWLTKIVEADFLTYQASDLGSIGTRRNQRNNSSPSQPQKGYSVNS